MTAISSTKSLKASVASALILSAFATTPVLAQSNAQFTVTGSYVSSGQDTAGHAVTAAPGNSKTLTAFQTLLTNAFNAGAGGDITFDNITAPTGLTAPGPGATFAPANMFQGLYGSGGSKTLTITAVPTTGTAQNFDFNTNNAAGVTSQSISTPGYLGANGIAPTDINFTFSSNLSDFGVMVLDRQAERDLTFTVTLSSGAVVNVSGVTPVVTSTDTTGPMLFEYTAASGTSISSVNLFNTAGTAVRIDDLGFAVAAPEPSQFVGLGLGVIGLGLLALKARKRIALDS